MMTDTALTQVLTTAYPCCHGVARIRATKDVPREQPNRPASLGGTGGRVGVDQGVVSGFARLL